MAGETFVGDIVGQFDNFGCVWIGVATEAISQIVVRFARVALTA